jgi:hypothetical protein
MGRNSLLGTTIRDPARLPEYLAADEHHADWAGRKGMPLKVELCTPFPLR